MRIGNVTQVGVNANWAWDAEANIDVQIRLMADAGVKIIRYPIYIALLEATHGVLDFSKTDRVVTKAREHGIEILALMSQHGSPAWANGGHTDFWTHYWPVLPEFYAEFCADFAEHFGSSINYYELGNEPDGRTFWYPAWDAVAYTEIMKAAYTAIKAVRPNSIVMTGGFSGFTYSSEYHSATDEYLTTIYENGGKDYFDAIGLHLYRDDGIYTPTFSTVDLVRNVQAIYNDSAKKIYITEYGFHTGTASHSVTEEEQATNLRWLFNQILNGEYTDIPFFCWYAFKDNGSNIADSESNYGVIHHQDYIYPYLPKAAYFALQDIGRMGRFLPTFHKAGTFSLYPYMDTFTRANGALGLLESGQTWIAPTYQVSTNKAINNRTVGSELIINGGFTTDVLNWVASNANLECVADGFSENCLKLTNVGSNRGYAYQEIATEIGQWYAFEVQIKNGLSSSYYKIGNAPDDNSLVERVVSSSIWHGRIYYFRATSTTTYITLGTNTTVDSDNVYYDSASLKKVTLTTIIAAVLTNLENLDISLGVTNAQWAQSGIILSLDDPTTPQNFVIVAVNSQNSVIYLIKCVGGVYSTVYQSGVTIVTGATVRAVKNGSSYQIYYNNQAISTPKTISDAEIISNKYHGMWLPDVQASVDTFIINSI